jgi:hypothetical protein
MSHRTSLALAMAAPLHRPANFGARPFLVARRRALGIVLRYFFDLRRTERVELRVVGLIGKRRERSVRAALIERTIEQGAAEVLIDFHIVLAPDRWLECRNHQANGRAPPLRYGLI